jgi:hypothetical protein
MMLYRRYVINASSSGRCAPVRFSKISISFNMFSRDYRWYSLYTLPTESENDRVHSSISIIFLSETESGPQLLRSVSKINSQHTTRRARRGLRARAVSRRRSKSKTGHTAQTTRSSLNRTRTRLKHEQGSSHGQPSEQLLTCATLAGPTSPLAPPYTLACRYTPLSHGQQMPRRNEWR